MAMPGDRPSSGRESFGRMGDGPGRRLRIGLIAPPFLPLPPPQLVIWPIDAGELPTIEEGKARLALLKAKGSSEQAFEWNYSKRSS